MERVSLVLEYVEGRKREMRLENCAEPIFDVEFTCPHCGGNATAWCDVDPWNPLSRVVVRCNHCRRYRDYDDIELFVRSRASLSRAALAALETMIHDSHAQPA